MQLIDYIGKCNETANSFCDRLIGAIAVGVPGAWYILRSGDNSRRTSPEGKTQDRVQLSGERSLSEDAKGGVKKRVDSNLQKNLGEDQSASGTDKVCDSSHAALHR